MHLDISLYKRFALLKCTYIVISEVNIYILNMMDNFLTFKCLSSDIFIKWTDSILKRLSIIYIICVYNIGFFDKRNINKNKTDPLRAVNIYVRMGVDQIAVSATQASSVTL